MIDTSATHIKCFDSYEKTLFYTKIYVALAQIDVIFTVHINVLYRFRDLMLIQDIPYMYTCVMTAVRFSPEIYMNMKTDKNQAGGNYVHRNMGFNQMAPSRNDNNS